MPANVGKGQFHTVNQSANRKERESGEKKGGKEKKTVSANVGKGQFHTVNQSADGKERPQRRKLSP